MRNLVFYTRNYSEIDKQLQLLTQGSPAKQPVVLHVENVFFFFVNMMANVLSFLYNDYTSSRKR